MTVDIRPYQPADLEALYRICLLTGWAGGDATGHYRDPRLLGHVYAAPYAVHDPGLCLVATLDGEPSGYVLGTADTAGFAAWAELHWFPRLRARLARPVPTDTSADAGLLRRIHDGYHVPDYSRDYPAHLHIDLLPALQGRRLGAELMRRFLDLLRSRGCPAVHLGVAATNTRAIAFYEKVGFHRVVADPGAPVLGLKLL